MPPGIQVPAPAQVQQPPRNISAGHANNMRVSLVRMYGGHVGLWQIDRNSGQLFNDNNGHNTTGHHNVRVTDLRDRSVWLVDFHTNGRYYTRSRRA